MQRKTKRIPILRHKGDHSRQRLDRVAVEEPLQIRVRWQQDGYRKEHALAMTMRTPGHDFALTAGFLVTEGIVSQPGSIENITHCLGSQKEEQQYNDVLATLRDDIVFDPEPLKRNFFMTSSCGICGRNAIEALQQCSVPPLTPTQPALYEDILHTLPEKLLATQSVFSQTGGIHAAGLFCAEGNLLSLHEDVGRHNAVDKLIGQQFLARQFPLHDKIILVSGRVSFDIVQKAIRAGIPVILAIGAPSSLAVDLSERFGLTLIGFLRDQRFNVYSGQERLRRAHERRDTPHNTPR